MKRPVVTAIGVGILLLLTVRMFFVLINREKNKKREFVSKLHYDVSARIDSLGVFNKAPVGFIYITITRGEIKTDEKKVNKSFKNNSRFGFLVRRKDGRFEIFSRDIKDYQVGDSIVVNSDEDKVYHFRAGEKLADTAISDMLRSAI